MMLYTRLQPILKVRNLDAEMRFYRDLQFEVREESPGFASVAYGDNILFGLIRSDAVDADALIWQVGVASVQAVYALCQQQHLPIAETPILQSWGEWTLKVTSPGGYVVIFEGGA